MDFELEKLGKIYVYSCKLSCSFSFFCKIILWSEDGRLGSIELTGSKTEIFVDIRLYGNVDLLGTVDVGKGCEEGWKG